MKNLQMRAATISEAGSANSFVVREVPIPVVNASDVLVRQEYAAVNHGDVVRRKRGMFAPGMQPPYILGFEGTGVVEKVGDTVTGIHPGERVSYLLEHGGYADYVSAPQHNVWRVPAGVSAQQAAAASCVGLTAYGLIREASLSTGEKVLVHGAAGGVGSMLTQMLNMHPVTASFLVSGTEKVHYLQRYTEGAIYDRRDTSSFEKLSNESNSYDVIFDCVGADVVDLNKRIISPQGRWMYYGSTSGHPAFPGADILMKSLHIQGFVVFEYFVDTDRWREGTSALGTLLSSASIEVPIADVFSFRDVAKAHLLLEERRVSGKLLLSF